MKLVLAALLVALILLFVSQAPARQSPRAVAKKNNSAYGEIASAPNKARARQNPLERDPDAPIAGKILFQQHCAECHGDAAQGGKKAPSLRVTEIQDATPGAIFWILTNGVVRRGMPVWSKLPEPQRWQLVSYIKSLTPASSDAARATPPN